MADRNPTPRPGQGHGRGARHAPDGVTLLAGLATLLLAGYVLSDGSEWLPVADPRWVVAGGAAVVGVVILVASLYPGRGRR